MKHSRTGFSLVELLTVIAIVAILAVLGTAALNSTLSAYRLSTGADALAGRLESARMLAATKNRGVEFQIIRPDGGEWEYFRVAVEEESTGVMVPYGKAFQIPYGTRLLTNASYGGMMTLPLLTVPGGERFGGAHYAAIRFTPNGPARAVHSATNTAPLTASNNFLTLAQHGQSGSELPPNWIALRIDGKTGAITRFQP